MKNVYTYATHLNSKKKLTYALYFQTAVDVVVKSLEKNDELIDSNGEFLHPRKRFKNDGIQGLLSGSKKSNFH